MIAYGLPLPHGHQSWPEDPYLVLNLNHTPLYIRGSSKPANLEGGREEMSLFARVPSTDVLR